MEFIVHFRITFMIDNEIQVIYEFVMDIILMTTKLSLTKSHSVQEKRL